MLYTYENEIISQRIQFNSTRVQFTQITNEIGLRNYENWCDSTQFVQLLLWSM